MIKKYKPSLFFCCLMNSLLCIAQDTIRVKKAKPVNPHNRYQSYMVEAGRQDLVFSETHTRVEYFYNQDTTEIITGTDYYILNDSTLMIDDSSQLWYFKKLSDTLFYVRHALSDYTISAYANSLMPLVYTQPAYAWVNHKSNASIDTLWSVQYPRVRDSEPQGKGSLRPYTSNFKGALYTFNEIDSAPCLLNGDTIPVIEIDRVETCFYNEPERTVTLMLVIITSDGCLTGIDQAIGNMDVANCPVAYQQIAIKIKQLGSFKAAQKNGNPVNVRWFVKVNVKFVNPLIKHHPIFKDNLENRNKYLKRLKGR